jgi:Fe-S cluster assembly iron-binding protein IscA
MFTITDKAISELKNIVKGPDMPEKPAIRVYAQSGGCCSTHHLGIEIADLATEGLTAEDFNGLPVVVEDDARDIAQNATIDFYDHAENPGFKVLWQKNLNSGGCGCQ